jgi:PAS domain-containing protein
VQDEKKKKTGHDDSADLRKRAEEALRESETGFRIALKSRTDVIWEWDIDTGRVERTSI